MKKFLLILGSLLLLTILAAVIIGASLGTIVKTTINTFGPDLTKTTVVLADARISPLSGSGTLTGLTIGNPTGWQSERAFFLGKITLAFDRSSLLGDHLVINELHIDQPEITCETKLISSNLQDLLKNIQRPAAPESATPAPTSAPAPEPSQAKPYKLEIKSLRLQNAKITLISAGLINTSIELPSLEMTNLGTAEHGLTPQQLATAILKEITSQSLKAASKKIAEKSLLNKAGEGIRNLLNNDKK